MLSDPGVDAVVTYFAFKTITALTGFVRWLVMVALIIGAGYWSLQGNGLEWLLAAILVAPGVLTFTHFRVCNGASKLFFDRPYRSESYRKSVNFGLCISAIGLLAVLVYRYGWA